MKKSSLTTAVVAGIAGVAGLTSVANAVHLNPDGLGQVLIYPYYTVNGGNSTLISVVNTTDEVKAVKVRFVEGRNSQEVLDFNLYLSPFDVWTGNINAAADTGPAQLTTGDNSCTVPDIVGRPGSSVEFVNFQYAANNDDGGPYELERTREGHVEMIEMGVVEDGSTHANAATHTAAGVPANCGFLRASWQGGAWASDPNTDILPPSGGLFGGGEIVDIVNGTNLSYNADAIDGFFVSATSNLHSNPGTVDPSLSDAQSSDAGGATAVIFDQGTVYTFDFAPGDELNAVSAVFMANEIYNEYNTNPTLGAVSEWVITFPTKREHIDQASLLDRLPFRSVYLGDSAENDYEDLVGACEPISFNYWDREERVPGQLPEDLIFSPPPPNQDAPGLALCYEAQVVTFNQEGVGETVFGNEPSAILGSQYARNINLCDTFEADGTCEVGSDIFHEGWIRMGLGDPLENFMFDSTVAGTGGAPDGHNVIIGLPATGFWAANYINANVEAGILANYSGLHRHRADRETGAATVTITTGSGGVVTDVSYSGFTTS
jgi:hypothetical protein